MVLETMAGVVAIEPGMQLLLSLCSLVTMVTVLTACVCCKKPMKHREDDLEEAYGVIPADDPTSPRVNFRFGNGHTGERHSQPASKTPSSVPFGPRTSAPIHHPPRALPPIPAEEDGVSALYAQIDKRAKSVARDDIEYADGGDGPTETYDTIDYDDDIDQLYSRVRPQARRYDYPQFKRDNPPTVTNGNGRKTEQRPPTDPTYQSASQLYGPTASEDPYSSIASDPRMTTRPSGDGGGDSSSAYDPGYARVRPEGRTGRSSDDVEGELDHLYSKIRRSASGERTWEREGGEERNDGSHPTASLAGLPGSRVASTVGGGERRREEQRRDEYGAVPAAFGRPGIVGQINNNPENNNGRDAADDGQSSTASRDPSYRYITVRESAETIRARLEREERLGPAPAPIREHYYSTIGSDRLYESVDDVPPRPPISQLAVDTASPSVPSTIHPPLPPTSPIPDRNALQAAAAAASTGVSPGRSPGPSQPNQLYAAINKPAKTGASKSPSPAPRPPGGQGNDSAPARNGDHTTTPAHNATTPPTAGSTASRPTARSPFGRPRHATIVKPEDDGFEGGPKVVRRPPQEQQRTPSEERSTVARGDGPARKESEERSTVAKLNVDLKKREQSPGRMQRDSSEDRSTQTVQRPSVVQDNGQIRDRRASPITVVSPGIPLMNGSLPPSMSSSINNPYGIDGSSVATRSIIDPMTSSLISESMTLPEEVMTTSVTTTETTSMDPSGFVSRRVIEERETICERRSACSSRSSSSVHFAASEDEMECGGDERSGAYSARTSIGPRVRHDSGGSQSARSAAHSSLERRRVGGAPGPEFTHGGDRVYRVPIHLSDSTQSLGGEREGDGPPRSSRSSRSGLPRRQSSEELRAAHERSRQRREGASPSPSGRLSGMSGTTTPRTSSRARKEEEMARRLGSTIYTGRDYISPIDLTTERGWPLVGPSSPPSLRREMAPMTDDDLTPRAPIQPISGRGLTSDRVNNNTPRKQPPPPITNGIFTCDLSSSEESLVARRAKYGGASGAEADAASHAAHCPAARRPPRQDGGGGFDGDVVCYCHTQGVQRADVWRSNHQEMHNIGYGRVVEEEIC